MQKSYNEDSFSFADFANSESQFGSSRLSPEKDTVSLAGSGLKSLAICLKRIIFPRLLLIFCPLMVTHPFILIPAIHLSSGNIAEWLNKEKDMWFCIKSFPEVLKSTGYQYSNSSLILSMFFIFGFFPF